MLDSESEQIREVYAMYGLAMYHAQCLERGLAMAIAVLNSERLTAWDYDARLAESFESTFGLLVTRFAEMVGNNHQQLLVKLMGAVDDRNKLTHHYVWDRAVAFCSVEGRNEMLRELASIGDRFASLDEEVSEVTNPFITEEVLQTHLEKLLSGAEVPHDPKRVQNPIVLVAAYEWRVGGSENFKSKLILASEEGKYLVLGERGLCFGPQTIPAEELFMKVDFAKALPAKVNPRPRKAKAWNFAIRLANGYELRVHPDELNGKPVCRFGLHRIKAMKKSSTKVSGTP
ncbi:MAG TPA: hypothetical protein VF311_05665 [Terriglobales bacterium]|jgi:hypothetical protein